MQEYSPSALEHGCASNGQSVRWSGFQGCGLHSDHRADSTVLYCTVLYCPLYARAVLHLSPAAVLAALLHGGGPLQLHPRAEQRFVPRACHRRELSVFKMRLLLLLLIINAARTDTCGNQCRICPQNLLSLSLSLSLSLCLSVCLSLSVVVAVFCFSFLE